MGDPFTIACEYLNDFQIDILDDCLNKGSGGMSLPMGSGKTLLSLVLALQQCAEAEAEDGKFRRILVVCDKSLLQGWETEIKRFFGGSLVYEVLHSEYTNVANFVPDDDTRVVITTIQVCTAAYKSHEVDTHFIFREPLQHTNALFVNHYWKPEKPYLPGRTGGGYLYSIKWGVLIIDEAQNYTNITKPIGQCLGAMCAERRWLLSGTMFNEPTPVRILGYHMILNYADFPRNLPEARNLIHSPQFKGIARTLVHRAKNDAYQPPEINEVIITHSLTKEEGQVYVTMRETLIELAKYVMHLKLMHDKEALKRFSSYLLAMLTYLREGLVCPIIPIASVAIDMADYAKDKNELADILTKKIDNLELTDWLNDPLSVKSSRICKVLETIDSHPDERVTLFCCFRSCIDILMSYLDDDARPIFTLTGNMTGPRRGTVLDQYRASSNGILLLTYKIGGQGINLQCSSTVLLLDYWWNAGMTNQAIARILRLGQTAKVVNVYFFSSNTGVENSILKKQQTKLLATAELQTGPQTTKLHKLKIQDIIRLIEVHENKDLLGSIYSSGNA